MRLFTALAVAVGVVALAGQAAADPPPGNPNRITVTLSCPAGNFTGVSIEQNSALPFQIEGETFVAITQAIWYTGPDGTVVVRSAPAGQASRDLVECTYDYPGFAYNPVHALVQLTGRGDA